MGQEYTGGKCAMAGAIYGVHFQFVDDMLQGVRKLDDKTAESSIDMMLSAAEDFVRYGCGRPEVAEQIKRYTADLKDRATAMYPPRGIGEDWALIEELEKVSDGE